eukprot:CAMPEP_0203749504 /NCGR_PEP_ID=MMETSP0098-20131031/4048_1 /ASSEMBLY_ACC=CAM_ASM_000208 /TAXON_ID=96639 /ORGANISM=" , Strain NY0313808BC1" /LENGTH=46 /DNA_ID= /DNA_START= /DNA_END= /DNA_ORIENTATION=
MQRKLPFKEEAHEEVEAQKAKDEGKIKVDSPPSHFKYKSGSEKDSV